MARPLAAFLLALMIFAGWAEAPAYAAQAPQPATAPQPPPLQRPIPPPASF